MKKILASLLVIHTQMLSSAALAGSRSPASAEHSDQDSEVKLSESSESLAAKSLAKTFGDKIKVSDFLKKIQTQVPENHMKVLREKLKKYEASETQIEYAGPSKIAVIANNQRMVIEFKHMESGHFIINGKEVEVDFTKGPEVVWKTLNPIFADQKATKTSLLMSLFEPKAEAFLENVSWPLLALGALAVGGLLYWYNDSNCKKYETLSRRCYEVLGNASTTDAGAREQYYSLWNEAVKFNDSWLNLSIGCDTHKQTVRSCIGSLGAKINGGGFNAISVQDQGPRISVPGQPAQVLPGTR